MFRNGGYYHTLAHVTQNDYQVRYIKTKKRGNVYKTSVCFYKKKNHDKQQGGELTVISETNRNLGGGGG